MGRGEDDPEDRPPHRADLARELGESRFAELRGLLIDLNMTGLVRGTTARQPTNR